MYKDISSAVDQLALFAKKAVKSGRKKLGIA